MRRNARSIRTRDGTIVHRILDPHSCRWSCRKSFVARWRRCAVIIKVVGRLWRASLIRKPFIFEVGRFEQLFDPLTSRLPLSTSLLDKCTSDKRAIRGMGVAHHIKLNGRYKQLREDINVVRHRSLLSDPWRGIGQTIICESILL